MSRSPRHARRAFRWGASWGTQGMDRCLSRQTHGCKQNKQILLFPANSCLFLIFVKKSSIYFNVSMLFTCRTSPCHLFSQLRMSLPGFEAATTARGRCAAGLRCFRTTSTYGSCLLQARLLKVWLNYRKHTWLTFSLPSDCIPRACTLGCAWSAKRYVCLFKRAKYSLAQNGLKLKECRMAAAQK